MENLSAESIAAIIIAAMLFLERVGKAIPDDAVGILGAIRKLSKALAGYIPNNTGKAKNQQPKTQNVGGQKQPGDGNNDGGG